MLHLKDIARIDLGSASYGVVSRLNGKPTAAIAIYQQPGSNSLDVSKGVKAKNGGIGSELSVRCYL